MCSAEVSVCDESGLALMRKYIVGAAQLLPVIDNSISNGKRCEVVGERDCAAAVGNKDAVLAGGTSETTDSCERGLREARCFGMSEDGA